MTAGRSESMFGDWSGVMRHDEVDLDGGFLQECVQVKRMREHGEFASGCPRPEVLGAVKIKLDPVRVRVAQIESFADAMVRSAFEWDLRCVEAAECIGQRGARGIEDRDVVEAGGVRGWRRCTQALPGVETDVMVIAASAEKRGGPSHALRHLKTENAVIEVDGAIEVGDFEVNVADARERVDGSGH